MRVLSSIFVERLFSKVGWSVFGVLPSGNCSATSLCGMALLTNGRESHRPSVHGRRDPRPDAGRTVATAGGHLSQQSAVDTTSSAAGSDHLNLLAYIWLTLNSDSLFHQHAHWRLFQTLGNHVFNGQVGKLSKYTTGCPISSFSPKTCL